MWLMMSTYGMLHENEFRNSSKNPFYPPGYGGKSLYPPLSFAPQCADAITFYTPEDRAFKTGHVYRDTLPRSFREWLMKDEQSRAAPL